MNISHIFDEYRTNRSKFELSIETLLEELKQYDNKIVLYGAGSAGISFLHYLRDVGIFPVAFSDGDDSKWGKELEGIRIISPKEIIDFYSDEALVIVTINTDGKNYCRDFKEALLKAGHQGVHALLQQIGCKNVIDYVYFAKCYKLFDGGKYNLPACADVYLMEKHQEEIEKVYEMLEDDLSKETYQTIVSYRMMGSDSDIPVISERKMYFEYELMPRIDDEVLVDCGACGGSSLKIFLEQNNYSFEKCYCLEPDAYNYNRLEEYLSSLDITAQAKITCINKAVYDSDFHTDFFVLEGPGTFAADIGTSCVGTIKIDSLLGGKKATYIKMNIEGSEIPAMKGAENTIRKYKPRLGIMGYHKTSDLWDVPMLMKKFRPDYKIYLRSYMKNIAFCYFAV